MNNRKLVVLALTTLAAFADGVAHQLIAPGKTVGPSDIVFIVLVPLLIFAWYRFDSDERAYRRTPFLNVSIIGLAVLALPYYFFRSRGFAQGSVAVCLFLICCFGYVVLQNAGEYAAYYAWQS